MAKTIVSGKSFILCNDTINFGAYTEADLDRPAAFWVGEADRCYCSESNRYIPIVGRSFPTRGACADFIESEVAKRFSAPVEEKAPVDRREDLHFIRSHSGTANQIIRRSDIKG